MFGRSRVGEKGFLFAEFEVGGYAVPIVNLHLHYASRLRRFRQMDRLLAYLREKERLRPERWDVSPIVCGDFNNPGSNRGDATSSLLSDRMILTTTRFAPRGSHLSVAPSQPGLDFVFLPPGCNDVQSEVIKSVLSDHRPVLVEFTLPDSRSARATS